MNVTTLDYLKGYREVYSPFVVDEQRKRPHTNISRSAPYGLFRAGSVVNHGTLCMVVLPESRACLEDGGTVSFPCTPCGTPHLERWLWCSYPSKGVPEFSIPFICRHFASLIQISMSKCDAPYGTKCSSSIRRKRCPQTYNPFAYYLNHQNGSFPCLNPHRHRFGRQPYFRICAHHRAEYENGTTDRGGHVVLTFFLVGHSVLPQQQNLFGSTQSISHSFPAIYSCQRSFPYTEGKPILLKPEKILIELLSHPFLSGGSIGKARTK